MATWLRLSRGEACPSAPREHEVGVCAGGFGSEDLAKSVGNVGMNRLGSP